MEGGFGSDFGSDFGSGGGGGGKLDPGLIMEQVKVQIAVANAQELLQVRRGRGGRVGTVPVPLCPGPGRCRSRSVLGSGGCPAARGSPAVPLALSSAGRGTRQRPVRPGAGPAGTRGASHGLSPQRMTDKCFRKCIGKPGGALDNSEQVSAVGEKRGPAGHPPARPLKALCPAEVHRHVHGPVHGRLEHGFPSLQLSAAAGESQHVKRPGSWTREGPCGEGTSGQSRWLGAKSCLSSP